MGGEQSGYWGAGCHQVVIFSICNVRSLKSGAPGTVWTWIMMAEFAMLSSMTGSPRCLFSIQGVSKSQTAGYIFLQIIQRSCSMCPHSEWMFMYLSKLFVCHQICTMGEGRLVSPPSVDTGLRVAWARSGILSKGMRSKIPREEFRANLGFWNLFYVVPAWLWFSRDPNYTTQYWVGWS